MIDIPPPSKPVPDWVVQAQKRDQLANGALPSNKAAVFDALVAAGITDVIVHFDGYGDSGQIEGIEAQAADRTIELPESLIAFVRPLGDGSGIETLALPIRDVLETLVYGFLEETHGGWENNEGAYGDFTFDVAKRSITLEYNERFVESERFEHSF